MSASAFRAQGRAAIIGAGCAGVSLGVRLLEAFPRLELDVYEARDRIDRDRTWCSWRFSAPAFPDAVTASWDRWIVAAPGRRLLVESPEHPYDHVPSDAFYDLLLPRLKESGRCRLYFGEPIDALDARQDDSVIVRTNRRDASYDFVFDARPPRSVAPGEGGAGSLEQHFLGQEIETESDAFDPTTPTLMDFDVDQSEGLHFFYVLPFSPRRALLEATYMTPPGARRPDYEERIRDYARERFGAEAYRVVRSERGVIPMSARRPAPPSTPRVWAIGMRGGATRPSTGYTFDAIQRDSDRIVAALRAGRGRPAPPRPPLAPALDRVLLSLLERRPEVGPRVFAALFRAAPTPALIRFLNDRPRGADTLRVAWAMPKTPIVGHLLRHPRAALA